MFVEYRVGFCGVLTEVCSPFLTGIPYIPNHKMLHNRLALNYLKKIASRDSFIFNLIHFIQLTSSKS